VTETQEFGVSIDDDAANVAALAEAWRRELTDQMSVSASAVQDRLLDLWGALPGGDARSLVEHWLTETLERNLYAASEVSDRLNGVLEGV
jgi:hypothetical protein